MKVIDRAYVESHKSEILDAIRGGSVFIYPTDTIYGLGCDATNEAAVQKIREIKQRDSKPLSVIAPSKEWIIENCELKIEKLNEYLPGPYTLFVKENTKIVAPNVNPGINTLGVRMPKHWFSGVVAEAGLPFVTTSVNISGEAHMQKVEDVSEVIAGQVDYCIYEGEKQGESSKKINLVLESQ